MLKQLHKDIYIPPIILKESAIYQTKIKGFDMTMHVLEHCMCNDSKSHVYSSEQLLKCLETIKQKPRRPFEIQIRSEYGLFNDLDWHITKICVRLPIIIEGQKYTDDLSVALGFKYSKDTKEWNWDKVTVITAWVNDKDDKHSTLRESEYVSETEWVSLCEEQLKKQQYYKYRF